MAPPASLPDIIPLDDIHAARERIKDHVVRFPLVQLDVPWPHGKVRFVTV